MHALLWFNIAFIAVNAIFLFINFLQRSEIEMAMEVMEMAAKFPPLPTLPAFDPPLTGAERAQMSEVMDQLGPMREAAK